MKNKDAFDAALKEITEAFRMIHERLERVENWMLLQESKGEKHGQDAN